MVSTKRILLAFSFAFLICLSCYAQSKDFTGVWGLKVKLNLAGPNYANGLPKQFSLRKTQDSIVINRLYEGGNDDYSIQDNLLLNGKPTLGQRTSSKRQSVLKKGLDPDKFSIEVTYRDEITGKQTSADFIENWTLSNKQLIIEKIAKDADGTTWSMKGIYEPKIEERIARGKGIEFADNLNWEEVKVQARNENKYIFVDCYATWCIPCKKMEKEIFPLNIIGKEVNDHFIAVHLQMDTTTKDSDAVKNWYPTAHDFLTKYNLFGYPTFLFFGPDGNIVHKGLGSYKTDDFIKLLKNARDSNEQYYTLLNSYNSGERNYEKMYKLIWAAKKSGETKQAEKVLSDYKNNFLNKLPLDSLLSDKYLNLANDFQQTLIHENGSKGNFFKLLLEKGNEVDAILNFPGLSSFYVNGIITKEEIEDKVYDKGKLIAIPQWYKITKKIESKYKTLNADKLVLDAQIKYYQRKNDWNNQIKSLVKKIEKYGPLSVGQPDGSGSDNTIANALLPHCKDEQILSKAVVWLEQIIHSDAYKYPIPMVYGNYGGLLYKAGRRKEGIAAFEKHLAAIGYKGSDDIDKDPRYKPKVEILERMKRGDKIDNTWKASAFF